MKESCSRRSFLANGLRWSSMAWGAPALAGCWSAAAEQVVAYVALDAEFSQPLLDTFSERTGVPVAAKFDTEATKTVGLAAALLAEANRPRCDLFWNNEVLHTVRLFKQGLLEPYESPAAANFAPPTRARDFSWHGFAARARVLLVNTNQVPAEKRPQSLLDLVHPEWAGKVAVAKPVFGTTATHAACLFALWGAGPARDFFQQLLASAQIVSGNKRVAEAVGAGAAAFGLTDTDDALVEMERGSPVEIVYPDQREGEPGTLLIPNTVALVKGGPNTRQARTLLDFLLSQEAEERLAQSASAQIPLNQTLTTGSRVLPEVQPRWLAVDWSDAADAWETAVDFLANELAKH